MQADFAHIDTWIFDLDNTLYPPSDALFAQMDIKMTEFVMRELSMERGLADKLRDDYWRTFGTTLSGLMQANKIDPMAYLAEVHDIDLSHMRVDADLVAHIGTLPGRKIVYTNGSRAHAENVTKARGLDHLFDAMYGIEDAGFRPKPSREAFDVVFDMAAIAPARAAFFEDEVRNLEVPKSLGLRTVLVGGDERREFVDYHAETLTDFLSQLAPLLCADGANRAS